MFVDEYSRGEPLPERPKVLWNLKQAFIACAVVASFGGVMLEASKTAGPFIRPSRVTLRHNDFNKT